VPTWRHFLRLPLVEFFVMARFWCRVLTLRFRRRRGFGVE
jgi:hypothetical protein